MFVGVGDGLRRARVVRVCVCGCGWRPAKGKGGACVCVGGGGGEYVWVAGMWVARRTACGLFYCATRLLLLGLEYLHLLWCGTKRLEIP